MRVQKMLAACSALTVVAALTLAAAPSTAQDRDQQNNHQAQNHGGDGRGGAGSAAVAGVVGAVFGAAIVDSQEHRAYAQAHMNDAGWVNSCQSRYHSFDRGSGTYLGRDGHRRYCH